MEFVNYFKVDGEGTCPIGNNVNTCCPTSIMTCDGGTLGIGGPGFGTSIHKTQPRLHTGLGSNIVLCCQQQQRAHLLPSCLGLYSH